MAAALAWRGRPGQRFAAYQLAGQLADIFDQYLVYRPDWIDAWQNGRLIGLGEDEIWQAELWRRLRASVGTPSPPPRPPVAPAAKQAARKIAKQSQIMSSI